MKSPAPPLLLVLALVCGSAPRGLPAAALPFNLAIPPGYWSFKIENDLLGGNNQDRFYTHGAEFSYTRGGRPGPLLGSLARSIPFFEMSEATGVSYVLGQKIFTPEDKEAEYLIPEDRPYAGWVYLSAIVASRLRAERDFMVANSLEATLGIVGPASFAGEAQNGVHWVFGSASARGWEHQLENELGLGLTYTRKWRFLFPNPGGVGYEIAPHLGAAIGNVFTYSAAGLLFRAGSGLRNDFGPPSIRPGFPGSSYFAPTKETSGYVFFGMEARGVVRDLFLDGNTFQEGPRVEKKFLVGDFQVGFAVKFPNFRIALVRILRTKEFERQETPQNFGAINLSYHQD